MDSSKVGRFLFFGRSANRLNDGRQEHSGDWKMKFHVVVVVVVVVTAVVVAFVFCSIAFYEKERRRDPPSLQTRQDRVNDFARPTTVGTSCPCPD